MDLVMPQLDGIGAIGRIKAGQPGDPGRRADELHRGGEGHRRARGRGERLHPQGRRGRRRRGRDPGRPQRRGPPRPGGRADPREGHADRGRRRRPAEPLTERELRGPRPRRPRPEQQGDRDGPRDHRADGADPRQQHPRQARPGEPDAGGALRRRAQARPGRTTDRVAAPGPAARRTGRRAGDRLPPRDPPDRRRSGRPRSPPSAASSDCLALDLPGHGVAADVPFTLDGRRRGRRRRDRAAEARRPGGRRRPVARRLRRDGRRRALAGAGRGPRPRRRDGRAGRPPRRSRTGPSRRPSTGSTSAGSTALNALVLPARATRPTIAEPIVAGGFYFARRRGCAAGARRRAVRAAPRRLSGPDADPQRRVRPRSSGSSQPSFAERRRRRPAAC